MEATDIINRVVYKNDAVKQKIAKKAEQCHNLIIESGDSIEEIMVIFNILKISMKDYIDSQIDDKTNDINLYKDMFNEIFK